MKTKIIFSLIFFTYILTLGCTIGDTTPQKVNENIQSSATTTKVYVNPPVEEEVKEVAVEIGEPKEEKAVEQKIVEPAAETKSDEEADSKIKEFNMIARKWDFTPDTIEVNMGDFVNLHVKSIDVVHGFSIREFGINARLTPNNEVDIEFIADKRGTFAFACSIPCGRGHGGMRGTLIVR